jgi:DNA-directed RNA polymerase subunit L
MEINIIKNEKEHIETELVDETHTLANALKDECYEDSKVVSAAYMIKHPLRDHPKIIVHTKGEAAKKALKDAATRLEKNATEFKTKFKNSL